MTKADLKTLDLPDAPGVYFFLDSKKKILYIGKATSLKNRVRSYFATDIKEKRSELIENMVTEAATVEVTKTESVLEALILETNLIRTHKPRYNTRSKDDKSYNHLVITNEAWPRVLVVRGKDLTEQFTEKEIKYHFGPFPSGSLLREALKIVRKLFQFYDTKEPVGFERTKLARGKVDFNRQIGLYPNHTDKAVYDRTIRHLKLFFEGKKRQIIKAIKDITDQMQTEHGKAVDEQLRIDEAMFVQNPKALIKDKERQMNDAVKILDFETAALLRDEIKALYDKLEKQNEKKAAVEAKPKKPTRPRKR